MQSINKASHSSSWLYHDTCADAEVPLAHQHLLDVGFVVRVIENDLRHL